MMATAVAAMVWDSGPVEGHATAYKIMNGIRENMLFSGLEVMGWNVLPTILQRWW